MQKKTNVNGFAIIELLIIIAVVLVLGVVGVLVYNQQHKPKADTTSTSSSTSDKSKASTSTSKQTATDPYAGWKSYCDTDNHYCFKYPTDWTFNGGKVLNPSNTVQVVYTNPDTRDGGPLPFTTSYVGKLEAANQDVSAVGGYYTMGSNYSPTYVVADSSLLTTYSLTVGQQGQFIGNASFANEGTDFRGQLVSYPTVSNASFSTLAAAQDWLNSADAKISLQILQSLSYSQ